MYPEELISPMRLDLVQAGFTETRTPEEVEKYIKETPGTVLVVINSVCGCAAANARPAVKLAVKHSKTPDHLITVFAGNDVEAVSKAREYMKPFPPSSPSIALFKDGLLVHMIERHHIEGRPADVIARNLTAAFDQFC
ncbi:MAG: BrxA/BrxB family bacilliredoxin [Thermaurantimonas sp.]